jgi:hypothetical protein
MYQRNIDARSRHHCRRAKVRSITYSERVSVALVIQHALFCRGHAVAQLVEALRYKPKRRGFHSRWCHWIFSLT